VLFFPDSDFTSGNGCLILNVSNTSYILPSDCHESYYSVYSRHRNTTSILQQAAFLKILADITIDTKNTGKIRRSLVCATNRDSVSKALGGTVGMVFLVVTCAVILIIDLPRTYACCHGYPTVRPLNTIMSSNAPRRSREHSRNKL